MSLLQLMRPQLQEQVVVEGELLKMVVTLLDLVELVVVETLEVIQLTQLLELLILVAEVEAVLLIIPLLLNQKIKEQLVVVELLLLDTNFNS